MSTKANTRDFTSQMAKMYYCGQKCSRRICKYASITPLLTYCFVKEMYRRRSMVAVILFHNHNYQGSTGKFIYRASILDNKQLLSNIVDCKATQVPYTTRIAFLADSYIISSNFPAILLHYCYSKIYIAIWEQCFWTIIQGS